jgi:hypothetical protein
MVRVDTRHWLAISKFLILSRSSRLISRRRSIPTLADRLPDFCEVSGTFSLMVSTST